MDGEGKEGRQMPSPSYLDFSAFLIKQRPRYGVDDA